MLLETMSVQEVARLKGVTEAGIRFALNDPRNLSLKGIKCGGRLMILASSVEGYTPRKYPAKPPANARQRRILEICEIVAAEMVSEHPVAASVLRAAYPGADMAEIGKPAGYHMGYYPDDAEVDGVRSTNREGTAESMWIYHDDTDDVIREKLCQWALRVVKDGWVESETR